MDNIREIIDAGRAERVERRVDEHDRQIEGLGKTLTRVEGMTTRIHDKLLGTLDEKGIIAEHRENVEFIAGCRKRKYFLEKERTGWRVWGIRLLYGALLSIIVAIITAVVVNHVA